MTPMPNEINSRLGTYVSTTTAGETVRAFVPPPLPPEPAVNLTGLYQQLDRANQALGRLDGLTTLLPDAQLFLYLYVRKEALLSSQIEGTKSSFSDLLLFENEAVPGVPIDDVEEVSNYVAAVQHGLRRIKGGFPLSLRLIREIHGILLRGGRGANKSPGEFRRSQNWIGGSRPGNAAFVPPPPQDVDSCMGDLERFLHSDTPPLVKAALAHIQFETIHPFLDGNGRIGRLLITLLLCHDRVLREPLLYSSLYFKQNRQRYYDELNGARESGDFERWLGFFATAIRVSAEQATTTGERIFAVFQEDRSHVRELGRQAPAALALQEALQSKPLATIAALTQSTGLTTPTVTQALRALEQLNIVRETTGRARGRIFSYVRYLDALNSEAVAPAQI